MFRCALFAAGAPKGVLSTPSNEKPHFYQFYGARRPLKGTSATYSFCNTLLHFLKKTLPENIKIVKPCEAFSNSERAVENTASGSAPGATRTTCVLYGSLQHIYERDIFCFQKKRKNANSFF